jgi:ATP dependent DNA ligase domain
VSRNGVDHTRRFRGLAAAVAKPSARTLVLDGEVAIYDQQLRSRFDWLRELDPDAVATPPLFMVFDMLYRDGRDLTAGRCVIAAPGWRTPSPAASWSSRCGGWRRTAWRRGARWSSAASRAWSPRTRRAPMRAGRAGWLKVKVPGWTVAEDRWRRRISATPTAG